MKFKLPVVLFLILALTSSCSHFEKLRRTGDLQQRIEAAYTYYEDKEYYKAGVLFDEALPELKGKEEAEKATFYRAQSYYYQGQYLMSAYYFKDFFDTYPRSKWAEQSLFLSAKSLYKQSPQFNLDQTSTYDALRALQKFANRYPKSELITEANEITDILNKKLEVKAFESAKVYYDLGKSNPLYFKSSIVAFADFVRHYPGSDLAAQAAYLKFLAQYGYAGSSVSSKQKDRYLEAIDFYENFVDNYPNSKYFKDAEIIYKKCLEKLEKIRS